MTVQTFRDLLAAQPFEPFRVEMSSGKIYEIRHPEMATVMKTNLMVFITDPYDTLPSRSIMCSYLHITAVGPLIPTTAAVA